MIEAGHLGKGPGGALDPRIQERRGRPVLQAPPGPAPPEPHGQDDGRHQRGEPCLVEEVREQAQRARLAAQYLVATTERISTMWWSLIVRSARQFMLSGAWFWAERSTSTWARSRSFASLARAVMRPRRPRRRWRHSANG